MTFLQAVILECLRQINGERTIYSVYHLLKGKKSSQTIQDAHLFRLGHYFKTFPQMDRMEYNFTIKYLTQEGFISPINDSQKYIMTENGSDKCKAYFYKTPVLHSLNGWKYQDTAILLWKRLTLLVQTISHLNHRDKRYQAVQRDPDVYKWIKQFLKQYKGGRGDLSKSIYDELHHIFSGGFPESPLMIVLKLTGRNLIGLTTKQVANKLGVEETEYHFRFLNALHYMIDQIISQGRQYPLLHTIISDIFQSIPYTKSTLKTYELLQKNMTIDQVAQVRKLRKSTIEDHVIEIALTDHQFSIDHLIDQHKIDEIIDAVTLLGEKKLRPIMEHIEHVSYFQIRLVLARLGGKCEQI
ncbi:helix-turn-helix domain-containing protein [Bacillus sp. FSL K6-3431]|uniref:helix-turn-helix domain-containing protein n=1 Tax=Bacillus sp. FSL K6-3431 TaxID=2921500 RepID=UPI0030FB4F4B